MGRKTKAVAIVLVAALAVACGSAEAESSDLPGARAIKVCASAGPFWPTMTLAVDGGSAWIACKVQTRVIRVNAASGRRTASVRLSAPVVAVKSGFGSIWALDGTLYRLNRKTGKVVRRIALGIRAPYNIWIGGGSVWVADDQGAQVIRVSPRTNRVVSRIPVGDGPASMAFDGGAKAWVINHRDTTIDAIDLGTNRSSRLATLGGDRAPERMLWRDGSLWVTGRGTDLLEVNAANGSVRRTIEIGGSGIDLVSNGNQLWVPTRSEEVDPSGFPTMDALKRVALPGGTVSIVTRPTSRLDVHGITFASGAVWIADNRRGYLYRVPGR